MSRDTSLKVVSFSIIASLFSVVLCQTKYLDNGLIEDRQTPKLPLRFDIGLDGKNEVQLSNVDSDSVTRPNSAVGTSINRTVSDADISDGQNSFLQTLNVVHDLELSHNTTMLLQDSVTKVTTTRIPTGLQGISTTSPTVKENHSTIQLPSHSQKQTTAWGQLTKITDESAHVNVTTTVQNGDMHQSVPPTMQHGAQITPRNINQTVPEISDLNPSESTVSPSTLVSITADHMSLQSKLSSPVSSSGARLSTKTLPLSQNPSSLPEISAMPSTQNPDIISTLEAITTSTLSFRGQSIAKTDILQIMPTSSHVSHSIELHQSPTQSLQTTEQIQYTTKAEQSISMRLSPTNPDRSLTYKTNVQNHFNATTEITKTIPIKKTEILGSPTSFVERQTHASLLSINNSVMSKTTAGDSRGPSTPIIAITGKKKKVPTATLR